jgi:hypothetical protein
VFKSHFFCVIKANDEKMQFYFLVFRVRLAGVADVDSEGEERLVRIWRHWEDGTVALSTIAKSHRSTCKLT